MVSSFYIFCLCLLYVQAVSQSTATAPLQECSSVLYDHRYNQETGKISSSSSLKSNPSFQYTFETSVTRATSIKVSFTAEHIIKHDRNKNTLYVKLDGKFIDKVKLNFTEDERLSHSFNLGTLEISEHTLAFVLIGNKGQTIKVEHLLIYQNCRQQVASHLNKPLNLPDEIDMGQNEPNPFSESTTIPFEILKTSKVTIVAYDKHMTPLDTITNRTYEAGYHFALWNSSDATQNIPEGLLLYSIETKDFKYLKKMFRIKPVH